MLKITSKQVLSGNFESAWRPKPKSLNGLDCEICGVHEPDSKQINNGWISSWYDKGMKGGRPLGAACPSCAEKYLRKGWSGEYELK